MRIGFIENTIGNGYIRFWFYRYDSGVWKKIKTETVPTQFRDNLLERVKKDACLVNLSIGHVG